MPPVTFCYTPNRAYTLYVLPRNTLFAQLTGVTQPSLYVYACLYDGRLLLAPDSESLSCYIGHLDKKEVLEELPAYQESVSGLSDVYNFMLVADLENMFAQPESYVRLIPGFFFRNPDFFRHFVLSAQFTSMDWLQSCLNQAGLSNSDLNQIFLSFYGLRYHCGRAVDKTLHCEM